MPRRWIQLPAACSLVFLFGCHTATDESAPAPAAAAPQAVAATAPRTGVVETAAGRYRFTPSTCAIHDGNGAPDIEVGGPGTAPDGERIYVEFSSTARALDIHLGVDTPFASPERSLRAGVGSGEMPIEVTGRTIRVAELELVDDAGSREAGSLLIEC
ncbi:MAG: hypothetical protein J0H15_01045 [Xanthomonadales bacterium]|nr:hypothetical protein [Xanthomonadales bacterium]